MKETNNATTNHIIEEMFKVGAHFGFSKSRRHPTVAKYIFGAKNNVEIFDLEKTKDLLDKAKEFVKNLAKEGKTLLIVGGKSESRKAVRNAAESINMPFVDGRWIGGTLTNAPEIRKRIEKYTKLTTDKEKGELGKFTKKERLLIDKEIENLESLFSGIVSMKELPKAIFVIDPRKEKNAVKEAQDMNIPIIALAGSDCDLSGIAYPIVGNDSSQSSIHYFVNEITKAYSEGKALSKTEVKTEIKKA